MLDELCQELRNWFDRERHFGTFNISNYQIDAPFLANGQYYRIVGSVFNDGIHRYSVNTRDVSLQNETFTGAVWALAIPAQVIKLSEDISAWRAKYEDVDSEAMSPFMSESYGGYSYQKNTPGSTAGHGSSAVSWQSVFAARLTPWRKI